MRDCVMDRRVTQPKWLPHLPTLNSIVYKRQVLRQMIEHIDRHSIGNDKISGYKRGHSTTTVLLHLRHGITKRGELTMAMLGTFSNDDGNGNENFTQK